MKKVFLWSAMALLSVFVLSFSSCNEDDVTEGEIKITDVEVGHHNSGKGTIGKDLHIEFKAYAERKIKAIEILITQGGKEFLLQQYTTGKYVGVLNTEFHEHIELPASTFKPGVYQLRIVVIDSEGHVDGIRGLITLEAASTTGAPSVVLVSPNESAKKGVAGGSIEVEATIETSNAIKEIELELHGSTEKEITLPASILAKYVGKSGKIRFKETLTIPTDCPAGEYHFHFTVEDANGKQGMGEFEGFTVTSK